MMKKLLSALILLSAPASFADDYWVTQYRAAPGNLKALIETLSSTQWDTLHLKKPVIMRHSQGNHWDLMLVGKWTGGSCDSVASCEQAHKSYDEKVNSLVDFNLGFVASSDMSWAEFTKKSADAGLFHIEMFNAAAGKHRELYTEREMENAYLVATGRKANAIFEVSFGSDIDNFTIGFHESMESFSKDPGLAADVYEKAATDAGFKNRADISFKLRELIVGHHDTLATNVK